MSTELSFERAAMRGDPMPDGLSFPDQLMFESLALLYTRYQLKSIPRDQAQNDKKKLMDEYRIFSSKWELGNHWNEIIKRTETARNNYRKNRTLENADKLLQALDF